MSNEEFLKRAEKTFVGGVNSPVRSFRRVGGNPIIAKSADGAFIEDADGKKYIDCVMSYGPHLFGHGYAPIQSALNEAVQNGLCFGMTSEKEIEWGEKALSFMPRGWKIRAVSSGTEACLTAVRLARGYTNREIIVKCSGHYHGHVDSLLFDAGSGVATLSERLGSFAPAADSAGLPDTLSQHLKIISFNDSAALEKVFAEFGNKIAALILEPVMGNMGVVLPDVNFLHTARTLTQKNKALLIFDEVMTGFRVHRQSAIGRFETTPDLATFGKIIGGGVPLAALAAPAQILETLSPVGKVYQAGTLSGNPLAVSAGLAMLEAIEKENPYSKLETLGQKLETAIHGSIKKKGINASTTRCGSMMSLFFRAQQPKNAADCRDIDNEKFKKFFWNAIGEGLMLPPSPFEAYFLSTAHLEIEDQLIRAFTKAIEKI